MLLPLSYVALPLAALVASTRLCWVSAGQGFDAFLVSLQVIGAGMTAGAIVAQRQALNVTGLLELMTEWRQKLQGVPQEASAQIRGVSGVSAAGRLKAHEPGADSFQSQIDALLQRVEEQQGLIQGLQQEVSRVAGDIGVLRQDARDSVNALEHKLAHAVTAGPSLPLSGLALVLISAVFQAMKLANLAC